MYVNYNANPKLNRASDCTVRAISKATGKTWEETYIELCSEGLISYDMPSANHVWGSYLHRLGFNRYMMPNDCPNCYTVKMFAENNPFGIFILALQGHVVTVIDGCYYDTWDSGDEVVIYYWRKNI